MCVWAQADGILELERAVQSRSFATWDITYIDKSFPQHVDVLTVHAADDLVRRASPGCSLLPTR